MRSHMKKDAATKDGQAFMTIGFKNFYEASDGHFLVS